MTPHLLGHGHVDLKRVHLADSDMVLRACVALAQYATMATERTLGDPVFDFVTEGRAVWPKYSACGDLGQFVAWAIGCRDPKVVNRDHGMGDNHWDMGMNLSKLIYGTGKLFTWAKPGILPVPGCLLYVSMSEHVCVLEKWDAKTKQAITHDFGMWNYVSNHPAGKRTVHSVTQRADGKWRIGPRTLQGWLDFSKLPLTEVPLVPLAFAEGVLDDCPYPEATVDEMVGS